MLECPKTAQMKDFLKLFKTVMDFKGLSFIVTEQPFNKKLRPVFYFATVIKKEKFLRLHYLQSCHTYFSHSNV